MPLSPEAVAAAANDFFAIGETIEREGRREATVVRTNNQAAIPAEALAELKGNDCRPLQDSTHWVCVGRGPCFRGIVELGHNEGATYIPPVWKDDAWQSTVYALRSDSSVVILCHQVDLP